MNKVQCKDCEKKIESFDKSHIEEIAKKFDIKTFAKVPMNPEIANSVDTGSIEKLEVPYLDDVATMLEKLK